MTQTLSIARIITPLAFLTLAACGGGGGGDNSAAPSAPDAPPMTPQSIIVQGSISDGPVVGANVLALDAHGNEIGQTTSNQQAQYSLSLPSGTALPVTLIATGGTDVVSNETPSFTLKSVSFATESATANINVYSTLAVHTARQMEGGLSEHNVQNAIQHVVRQFNFGLDTYMVPNPITTPISASNIATAVRSSEALSQMLKRSHLALQQGELSGAAMTQDKLIESLAADLTDGVIDGRGGLTANPRNAAVSNVTSAGVLLETLHNKLKVNGQDATQAMDEAIRRLQPDSDARSADAPTPSLMLTQAVTVLTAANVVAPSPAMEQALQAVRNVDPQSPEDLRGALSVELEGELSQAGETVALITDPQVIEGINNGAREVAVIPELPEAPGVPTCAGVERIPVVAVNASAEQEGNPAANAIDGDAAATRWAGGAEKMPHWITFDLGETHLVNRTRVSFFEHDNNRIYRYSVHGSIDGQAWLPVFENRESAPSQWTQADFSGINARYVRVTLESANNGDGASLYQAEIHGQPAALACGNSIVTVAWNANSDNVIGYRVFAGDGAANTDRKLSELALSSGALNPERPQFTYLPWEDLGLRSGENVCFRLRAYNDKGESDWSNAVCAGI